MSSASPSPVSYEPRPMSAPKVPLSERINLRLFIFAAVVLFLIGAPFYIWLRETVTGGVINHGDFAEVDLKAMSTFDLDQFNGSPKDVPQRFRDLEGKKVMLVGEMWQPHSAGDDKLNDFQLVYSKTKCCFSGPPLAQHFVQSDVKKGVEAYYYDVPVNVYGTLHIRFKKDGQQGGKITNVYQVDVDKVEPVG